MFSMFVNRKIVWKKLKKQEIVWQKLSTFVECCMKYKTKKGLVTGLHNSAKLSKQSHKVITVLKPCHKTCKGTEMNLDLFKQSQVINKEMR